MKRLILPLLGYAYAKDVSPVPGQFSEETEEAETYEGFDVHFSYDRGVYHTSLYIGTPAQVFEKMRISTNADAILVGTRECEGCDYLMNYNPLASKTH